MAGGLSGDKLGAAIALFGLAPVVATLKGHLQLIASEGVPTRPSRGVLLALTGLQDTRSLMQVQRLCIL
jgi:hypothetical protein